MPNLKTNPIHRGSNKGIVWQILDWSNCSNSRATIVDVFCRDISDILSGDIVNSTFQFLEWDATIVAQHLTADIFTNRSGACRLVLNI